MKISLLFLLTFIGFNLTAQKDLKIEAKQINLNKEEDSKLSEILKEYKAFSFSGKNLYSSVDKQSQDITFNLEGIDVLSGKTFSFIDSRIITEKTINRNGNDEIPSKHYRATGLKENEVFALSIFGNSIGGSYRFSATERIQMLPLTALLRANYSNEIIIVFNPKDIIKKDSQLCRLLDVPNQISKSNFTSLKNSRISSVHDYCRIVEVAIEGDNEWAAAFPGIAKNIMELYFNIAQDEFLDQANIELRVANSYVWTSTDPYTTGYPDTGTDALTEFRNYWITNNSGISRNLAFLFSLRNHDENTGIAYSNSVCGNYAYAMLLNPLYIDVAVMHEVAHAIGHPGHDNSTSPYSTMHETNDYGNVTFSSYSIDRMHNYLHDYGDNSCVVTGEINMFLNSQYIDAYETNSSCTYAYEYLYAPGANSISWSLTNSGASASVTSSSAQNAQIYSGSSSGSYEVHATKVNDCGTTNRYYPFYVDNCFFMKVFPNATSDFLYIEFGKDSKELYFPNEISLVDEQSNVLITKLPHEMLKNNEIDPKDPKIILDLSDLPSGTYYLRSLFKNRKENQYETKRILKLSK